MQKNISIISDWQKEDFYTVSLRSRLLQLTSGYDLSVITHDISQFDSMEAAFVLKAAWKKFPKGSIHLNCVNSSASPKTPQLLIVHKSHYFIGADLGYWPFIIGEQPEHVYLVNDALEYEGSSFPEYHVFAQLAAAIAKGMTPEEIGCAESKVMENTALIPVTEGNLMYVGIVYFDSFGNAMTNLERDQFEAARNGRKFVMSFISERNQIRKISESYLSVKQGEFLALFNSLNLLEIAMREANVRQLMNLEVGVQIRIEFFE
ncbi:MAG: SAM-dependent chlorinase/fluorinase [Bacteroidales bacterium]|jgi:S-adenosylmethionine hydrolase|nr:SAM-dependent chlorinase/fluorinase [Bacteroidales bacterium]